MKRPCCLLEFTKHRSYGRNRYYPQNKLAHALVLIAGRICLEDEAVRELIEAGFSVLVAEGKVS